VLRIDGDLEGPRIRGGALIVGERARIQADLDVDLLLVCGQLQGEIRARQRVELRATSRVTGTIWAPRVEIWPGAVFRGTCHVGNETRALVEEWAGRRAVGTWIR
jgi:cytoskeletal protein CcmA (bactofilin family)